MTRQRGNRVDSPPPRGSWPHACVHCGYDIRQTLRDKLRRCPECGRAIKRLDPDPPLRLDRFPFIAHATGLAPTYLAAATPWLLEWLITTSDATMRFFIAGTIGAFIFIAIWAWIFARRIGGWRSVNAVMTLFGVAVLSNAVLGLTVFLMSLILAMELRG